MTAGEGMTIDERETFRRGALAGIHVLRDALRILKAQRLGSIPDLLTALELVDRIESWVSRRVLPGQLRPLDASE
jgi:hypothetical protein